MKVPGISTQTAVDDIMPSKGFDNLCLKYKLKFNTKNKASQSHSGDDQNYEQ